MADEPQLAPPGAGLPWIELHVGRRLFALARRGGSRETFDRRFREERDAIRRLVVGSDPARRGERVLIKRLRGLEDSSRFWSVWMTLDHLRICNEAFARVITDLSHDRTPEGRASTADVKPSVEAGVAVEEGHEQSCERLLAAVAATAELKTAETFSHPWFGPLDAAGWHALAGMHLGIHRRQITRIIDGLPR